MGLSGERQLNQTWNKAVVTAQSDRANPFLPSITKHTAPFTTPNPLPRPLSPTVCLLLCVSSKWTSVHMEVWCAPLGRVCVCVWFLTVKPLCPPRLLLMFHFFFCESLDHQCYKLCVCVWDRESKKKSTQGFSKWFKRDVRGLQHMVGSDFLMQIGKDQIKAAWQPINQPSNQTWQLSIMAPSSPRNPIVCTQLVYLILKWRKKKKKNPLRGRFLFFFPFPPPLRA